MANVFIAEYADYRAGMPYGQPIAAQTIATTTASAQSAAFNDVTNFIRVHTDGIMSYKVGTSPSVTTNDMRVEANGTFDHCVKPGDKIAVITNS